MIISPDPFYHIMVGIIQLWLKYLQVANLKPRGGERHLENILKPLNNNHYRNTSKFIEIGGLVHFFFVSVSSSSISADI